MRIVVAESHAVTLRALVLLLRSMPDLQVIGEAGDQQELLAQIKNKQPDLVILDVALPDRELQELVSTLQELDHGMGVIVMAIRPEVERPVLKAGADAFVLKGAPPKKLLLAIEALRKRGEKSKGGP
jgi:DNA-binding NarL/FixJ family response regulator